MMRAINDLVREEENQMIYIDDILIAHHTYEEQMNTIRQVLRIAKENELWFNKH